MTEYHGYIGTYTKENSEGIYSFTLDTEAERITNIKVAAKIENPTYLTIGKDNKTLYAVAKAGESGGVAAFSLKDHSQGLTLLNKVMEVGSPPCHVSLDDKHQYLLSSNYHKGTVTAYKLEPASKEIQANPSVSQHPTIDEKAPHTHYAAFTPDEKYIVVVDLGIDQILTYTLNNDQLEKVTHLQLKKDSGPRHLVFHPNGKYAYVMTEFSSEVIVLSFDQDNGTFTEIQSISTLPTDFTKNNQGSAIHVSSDGQFIYAGNRGHNSIAIFHIDRETYKLSFLGHVPTEGDWPRDFSFDPTEAFIVASNQESGNLVLYKRDKETGLLSLLQSDVAVPHPVCVKFLNL